MKHIVEGTSGKIYEVTSLFDRNSVAITEPWRASTCVIKVDEDRYSSEDADQLDIHTVH